MTQKTLDIYLKQTVNTTIKQDSNELKYKIVGFYKETKFKETLIGKIPKEWNITKLGNVAKINESKINTGSLEGEIARIPMELIPNDSIYAKYVLMPINEIKSYITAKAGDILLAKITPCFENGKQGIVPDDVPHGIALVTTEVYPITPINIDRLFLFYLLKWRRYRKLLEYRMTGTTGRKRIPKKTLEDLVIPLPPLEEQKHIATILSTIDNAIEVAEEYIVKLERLKRGLMWELLTKGIGHKEFKGTPIGKIPKDWRVIRLKDIFAYVKGRKPKALVSERKDNYLPYLTTDYLRTGIPFNYVKPGENVVIVNDNDIILLWDGSNAGEFFLGKRGVLASTMVKLIPKDRCINTIFYFYCLKLIESYLKSLTKGTGIPHVDRAVFENLYLVKPPLKEQSDIAEILLTIDKWIELEKRRREKLKRLKHGLMELLLTGRVRVRV